MIDHEIYSLTTKLLAEYEFDQCRLYAHVCNNTMGSNPDPQLLAIKHELQRRMAEDMMEEYFWEREDTGAWRKVEYDEFAARLQAAREARGSAFVSRKLP